VGLGLPVKGCEHTGKPVDSAFLTSQTVATVEPMRNKASQ
jgi:hypothetical protein